MAQIFKPLKAIYVPATGGHPTNTEYRVAWGIEKWEKEKKNVTKVQISYNGVIAGMLSPSFPDNTIDLKAVYCALSLLNTIENNDYRYMLLIKDIRTLTSNIKELENEVDNKVKAIYASKKRAIYIITKIELHSKNKIDTYLYGFLFKVKIYSA